MILLLLVTFSCFLADTQRSLNNLADAHWISPLSLASLDSSPIKGGAKEAAPRHIVKCRARRKVRFIGHLICYDTLTPTEKGAMNYGSKKTDDGKSRPGGG